MEYFQTRKDIFPVFQSIRKFLLMNLLIALVIVLVFTPFRYYTTMEEFQKTGPALLINFMMSAVLSYGGFVVECYYDKRISWIDRPVKRLLLQSVSYLIYAFAASYLVIVGYMWAVLGLFTFENIPWMKLLPEAKSPMFIAFGICAAFISYSFLSRWREAAVETERLKTARYASQYQSLKNQLNPHFLFNSLNALSNLVYENADASAAFIRKLSRIYRYVLEVQEDEIVALTAEVTFAENYLALQKIRFEDSLEYTIRITETNGSGYLPPLSLQLLLENAMKHNEASRAHPLKISIFRENDLLTVQNNYRPRNIPNEESTGIGLDNICKRYEILGNRPVEIIPDGTHFTVKLPILENPAPASHLLA